MFNGYLVYFLGVERPGSEVDCSPQCRAKAKLERRCTSAPYVFLRDMKRDNFACNFCCNMFRAGSYAGLEDLPSKTMWSASPVLLIHNSCVLMLSTVFCAT
jgi:hypothetical protein